MARRRRKSEKKEDLSKTKPIQSPNERDIVVLFADVVGCSEISNNKEIKIYNQFINDFQDCFKKVCEHYEKEEYKGNEQFFDYRTRGDEGCLKIFVQNRDDLTFDIDNSIKIALDIKRKWLLEDENRKRIDDGLLPIDIAIGIHAGKVFINKEKDEKGEDTYRPEGYAINLAKRVESASRRGKFSHVLVSESAHGQLYNLRDQNTYRFDTPFTISPKGISRNIKVFEIKHHFLPTDWNDKPSEVSMMFNEIGDTEIDFARRAYGINPMNLWLAEEYILLDVINSYKILHDEGKEDDLDALKTMYAPALRTARDIANSVLRDAGVLALLGFVLGEQRNYQEEQKRYEEALKLDEQDGDIHWYLGYSISCELEAIQNSPEEEGIEINDFYSGFKEKIDKTLKEFDRALELRPMNAWIIYDYACELSWWSQAKHDKRKDFRKKAIDLLIRAFGLNLDTKKQAEGEDYLKPIIDDPKVKKHLDNS